MGFTKTRFIADHWHLFNQVFPKSFGLHLAQKLSPFLSAMVYSGSKDDFDVAYIACKQELMKESYVRGDHLEFLKNLYEERDTYAAYSISNIKSSRGRKGSTSSEANHSSLIIHLNGVKSVNTYKEKPLTLIKDVIHRQAKHITKWNRSLFNENREMKIVESRLANNGDEKPLKEAAAFLNKRSYSRFANNWQKARRECFLVGGDTVKSIADPEGRGKKFLQADDGKYLRCGCKNQIGFEEQCVHEIVLFGCQFKKNLFATWHERRKQVTSSPIPAHLRSQDNNEEEIGKLINEVSDNHIDQTDRIHQIEEVNSPMTEKNSFSYHEQNKKATSFNATQSDFFRIQKEVNGCLRYCDQEVLNKVLAIELELLDVIKYNNQACSTINDHKSIDECFEKIIRNFKKSFNPSKRSFLPQRRELVHKHSLAPNHEIQKSLPQKRLKTKQEIIRMGYHNKQKRKATQRCSFCSSPSHKVTSCPKKESYIKGSNAYVLHLNSNDFNLEDTVKEGIEKNLKLVQKVGLTGVLKHLTHNMESRNMVLKVAYTEDSTERKSREEYEKELKDNVPIFYERMTDHMDAMWKETRSIHNYVFGVFLLDCFGECSSEMHLISGMALETFIRNAAKKKNKTYLFDETHKNHSNADLEISLREPRVSSVTQPPLVPRLSDTNNPMLGEIEETPFAPVLRHTVNPMEEELEDTNDWFDTYEHDEQDI